MKIDIEQIWETLGEFSRYRLLQKTTIPKKYHEGLVLTDELKPYNTITGNKLILKKLTKAYKKQNEVKEKV